MSARSQDVNTIKDAGWRQGSALPSELVDSLTTERQFPWDVSSSDILIVLSHDCDITNASLLAEPNVEILRLRSVQERNGNLDWGKNPRRYQFIDSRTVPPSIFEVSVHDRAVVPRDRLIGHFPDTAKSIDDSTRSRLCLWVAARYTRAAFPDAFNDRIMPAVDELRPQFKSKGHFITGIYLHVIDDELPQEEDYALQLIATMIHEHYVDPTMRASAQDLVNRIEAAIASCSGLSLAVTELRSEAELSIAELRKLKRWDFDDLSLRRSGTQDLPPSV